jgi:hypothetical protein
MKNNIKRYILSTLLLSILTISMNVINVNAEESSEEPTAYQVIEYVLATGDKDYLQEYGYLLPGSLVSELLNANPSNWEQMLKDEDARLAGKQPTAYNDSTSTVKLTKSAGTVQGPSGKETYYNLNMSGVVKIMRNLGYTEDEYPYWVRDDGCKMFGDYIIVAANLSLRPRGTIVETSLGQGIVCDTGGFALYNTTQLDIATNW